MAKSRRPPQRGKRHDTPKTMMHPPAGGSGVSMMPSSHALRRDTEVVIKKGQSTLAMTPKLVAKKEKGRE